MRHLQPYLMTCFMFNHATTYKNVSLWQNSLENILVKNCTFMNIFKLQDIIISLCEFEIMF